MSVAQLMSTFARSSHLTSRVVIARPGGMRSWNGNGNTSLCCARHGPWRTSTRSQVERGRLVAEVRAIDPGAVGRAEVAHVHGAVLRVDLGVAARQGGIDVGELAGRCVAAGEHTHGQTFETHLGCTELELDGHA